MFAAVLTWVLPAGQYERAADPETGREMVLAGTYQVVDADPVGPMEALIAVPQGIVAGAEIVVVILMVGGVFVLLEQTGALGRLVGALVDRVRHPTMVIVFVALFFSTLGALVNLNEEVIAMVPILLLLSHRIGYGAVTAVAMSLGAAVVGAAFGPTNPFGAGLALQVSDVDPGATFGLRLAMLGAAVAVWIGWTVRQARNDDVRPEVHSVAAEPATGRDVLILACALIPFGVYVFGLLRLNWGVNEMSALFLVSAYAVGLLAGFGVTDTTVRYLRGMESMLVAGLLVGVARSISIVLTDGRIIDTIVHGLASPLDGLPETVAAGLMIPIQALLHVPVSSNSGHAALAMPIFAPAADVLGLPRNVAVMAYQAGGITMDMITPTAGALLAVLLSAKVPFARWLRFALPGALLVMAVGFAGMLLAM